MGESRQLHYVPSSYLARFTPTNGKGALLYVHDIAKDETRPSKPDKQARKRDFYRLDVKAAQPDRDPLAIESFLAELEGHGREAIDATLDAGRVPDGELREKLMMFISMMSVRVPASLDNVDRFHDRVLRTVLWYQTGTERAWSAELAARARAGDPVPTASRERLHALADSGEPLFALAQNSRLKYMLHLLVPLAHLLGERSWTLVRAADDAPDFICSDRPVSLHSNANLPPGSPLGFGLTETTVIFPLNRRAALLGLFEGSFSTSVADASLVGHVNFWTAIFATRYIYTATPDFVVTRPDGQLADRTACIAALRRRRPAP